MLGLPTMPFFFCVVRAFILIHFLNFSFTILVYGSNPRSKEDAFAILYQKIWTCVPPGHNPKCKQCRVTQSLLDTDIGRADASGVPLSKATRRTQQPGDCLQGKLLTALVVCECLMDLFQH